MTYFATFTANNGSTYLSQSWLYTNKAKAISEIKAAVKGNHFRQTGNVSSYIVTDGDGIIVAAGKLHDCGRWTIDHEAIGWKL